MDCQLGCRLKGLIWLVLPGANRDSACPARGTASMWAEAERTEDRRFATVFGRAFLHGLPQAIAAADQLGAQLAFLSIIPAAPSTDKALTDGQENVRMRTLQRLAELPDDAGLGTRPQLYAEFKSGRPVSEKILETADKLRANLIIMGLHDSAHAGILSHLDLSTTYDVICQPGSPVLTVN